MKKTLKKLISLIAVAAIVATSSVVALANNEYMSYSNDFSSATGVTINNRINGDGRVGDIVMAVEDGVLKSTRNYYDKQDGSKRAESGKTSIAFGKSFSEGEIQVKFDFTLNTNRAFLLSFDGYQKKGDSGIYVREADARLIYPSGSFGNFFDYEDLVADTEYTMTATLDIETATFEVKIVKKNDPTDIRTFTRSIPAEHWPAGETHGAVTGISIWALRAQDVGTGTMTFDNLSVDAYTKYNYEIGGIYKSANGLETNKPVDGFELKNYTLNKFTNFINPNATFITAGYDADGRMADVVATPITQMGKNIDLSVVEGDVVKAFVFDMSDASPMMSAFTGEVVVPSRTVRKLDFDSVSSFSRKDPYRNGFEANTVANISTYDIVYAGTWAGVAFDLANEGENKFLKVERSSFKSGSTFYSWDDTANAWETGTSGAENNYFGVKLDESSDNVKVTLKFKFAGTENASQIQYIDVNMGGQVVRISRNQNGEGSVNCGYSATNCTWTGMKANEWYTFTGEITASGFKCSVAGDFNGSYDVKNGANAKTATAVNYVQVGSPRDADVVPYSLTEVKTPTSVWYIDDVVVEY